jgi:hypothetical protein
MLPGGEDRPFCPREEGRGEEEVEGAVAGDPPALRAPACSLIVLRANDDDLRRRCVPNRAGRGPDTGGRIRCQDPEQRV